MPAPFARQRPRACVACRTEAPKRALVRIVRTPAGEAVLDPTGKLPGRGAYVCPNLECLAKARKTGSLERALKTAISDACWEELERRVKYDIEHYAGCRSPEERVREVRSLLGFSRRAGLLVLGSDAIRGAGAAGGRALLLLTAQDCSESVSKFARGLVETSAGWKHGHACLALPLDTEGLSASLGAGNVQIVALPARSGLADKLRILLAE